jgi:hypothetical protein
MYNTIHSAGWDFRALPHTSFSVAGVSLEKLISFISDFLVASAGQTIPSAPYERGSLD